MALHSGADPSTEQQTEAPTQETVHSQRRNVLLCWCPALGFSALGLLGLLACPWVSLSVAGFRLFFPSFGRGRRVPAPDGRDVGSDLFSFAVTGADPSTGFSRYPFTSVALGVSLRGYLFLSPLLCAFGRPRGILVLQLDAVEDYFQRSFKARILSTARFGSLEVCLVFLFCAGVDQQVASGDYAGLAKKNTGRFHVHPSVSLPIATKYDEDLAIFPDVARL